MGAVNEIIESYEILDTALQEGKITNADYTKGIKALDDALSAAGTTYGYSIDAVKNWNKNATEQNKQLAIFMTRLGYIREGFSGASSSLNDWNEALDTATVDEATYLEQSRLLAN
jgi:hypothetical protein